MYSIQNLTKTTIKFQGVTIGAYATVTVPTITDYITLSRLSNSGKIRYFNAPIKKVEPKVVKEDVKKNAPVEPEKPVITETIPDKIEKKDTSLFSVKPLLKEETKEDKLEEKTVTEDVTPVENKVESKEEVQEETKTTRKSSGKKNKRSEDK